MKAHYFRHISWKLYFPLLFCLCIQGGCSKSGGSDPTPAPTVTIPRMQSTTFPSEIAPTTAKSGGTISDDGGAPILARGVCWNTTSSPTISDSFTKDSIGVGYYWSFLTGLTPNTEYYVRAYATNKVGTAYANEFSFTTLQPKTVPVLRTEGPTSINDVTAITGGTITADGGSPVTERGVCWNTTGNPTIVNSRTKDGSGIGYYFSPMAGLTVNVKYYVRAYATNGTGTGYGNEITFTTVYTIGQPFQGGRIFYIDETKVHGLIAALADQPAIRWDNHTTLNPTGALSFTDGKSNTTKIVNTLGVGPTAALACDASSAGGYTDWYLPASQQLYKLFQAKAKIPGLANGYYWSSTESSDYHVYAVGIDLAGGTAVYRTKNNYYLVRAIRNF